MFFFLFMAVRCRLARIRAQAGGDPPVNCSTPFSRIRNYLLQPQQKPSASNFNKVQSLAR